MTIPSPRAALLIVDLQEDFCEPDGSLALLGGREIASKINQLLEYPGFALRLAARDFHPPDHISFASTHAGATSFTSKTTTQNPKNSAETHTVTLWPDHCVQGTAGCNIIPELQADKLDAIIEKGTDEYLESYSAFGPPFRNPPVSMTRLDDILKAAGITHVFCVGLSFNVCVFHSAVDAAEHGYETFVIEDATASTQSPDGLAATRKSLVDKGVAIVDMDSEALNIARGSSDMHALASKVKDAAET